MGKTPKISANSLQIGRENVNISREIVHFANYELILISPLICRLRKMCGRGRDKVTLEEVQELMENFMREPENPEDPFIVAGHLVPGDEEENTHLSLVISSSSIIENILHDPVDKGLHIDYTHGLSTGIYFTFNF